MPSSFPFHGIFSHLGEEDQNSPAETQTSIPPSLRPEENTQRGQVAVDIYELDNYVVIRAPIAGVHLSDIDIEVIDNELTIRGTRKQSDTVPADQYYLQECFWGPFERKVKLPFAIDPKKIRATFNKECILKILIPKEERVKIVRISEG